MKRNWQWMIILFVALGLGWSGCKKKTTAKHDHKEGKASSRPAATKGDAHWVVDEYAKVRKAFSADDLKAGKAAAQAFGKAAGAAAKKATGAEKTVFASIVTTSSKLGQAKDLAAARLAFGDLSKHVINYLSAHAKLQKDITTYSCPMAKGYKKWVQHKTGMANPYMGKKMATCGSKVKLAP